MTPNGDTVDRFAGALVLAETIHGVRRFLVNNAGMQATQNNTNRLLRALGKRGIL